MNRMGRWLVWVVGVAALGLGAEWAIANEAPIPLPPRAQGLPLVVRIDPNARVSRLILPPEAAGGEQPGEIPAPGFGAPAPNEGGFFDSTPRTVVAGLCMSLAAFGLFFVTRVGGSAKLVMIGLVGATALAGGAVALADIAPDPFPRPRPPRPAPAQQARVIVEWTGRRGAPVTLIIAAGALQIGDGAAPGVGAPPPREPGFGAPPPPTAP